MSLAEIHPQPEYDDAAARKASRPRSLRQPGDGSANVYEHTRMISLLPKIQNDGYAFLESFHSGRATIDLLALVGNAVALGKAGPVHQLRPRRVEEAPLNTYSGNYGLGEFPLHTDLAHWYLPSRYFLLRWW
jgi:hypothetical protein